jgi:predicted Zn-dependent protease
VSVRARDEALGFGDAALRRSTAANAEVIVAEEASELTRFAGNLIHQSVSERSLRLRARVIGNDRVGVAELRGEGEDAAGRVMQSAEQARALQEPSRVTPLPAPDGGADSPVAYSDATSAATPERRAEMVATVITAAAGRGLKAYGSLSTATSSTAIVNSAGVRRHATTSQSSMVVVVRGEDGAGYAARHSADIDDIDAAELAAEVIDTCERNQHATTVDPGDYEVVLSPYAVTDLLEHLSWVGFSALAKQEQRSFMRIGERLMSERVTVVDDCRDAALFPFPFDDEGVSTQVVTIIDRGECAAFVYDTPTAASDGIRSTGHGLPQPNTWGPYARHLLMRPGDVPSAELIAGVRRGIYVTRLWYVRDVHPLRTIITGMTREGTFLIENGVFTRPVRDLRFTQSIVEALDGVLQVSSERRLELGEDGAAVCTPWLHIGRFSFTS